MSEALANGRVTLHCGDMLEVLKTLPDCCVDSVCTDPPYHLTSIIKRFGTASKADDTKTSERARAGADGMARMSRGFMGKQWDGGDIAFRDETWREVYRVLKPGAHLLAFSGTRTYHRMATAIEDAGFEIRDCLAWLYGSGFPKSHNVGKSIDKAAGAERGKKAAQSRKNASHAIETHGFGKDGYAPPDDIPITEDAAKWNGWGTALKPALEPICFARKPLIGTIVQNVLAHGTGALNIDGCRIEGESTERTNYAEMGYHGGNLAKEYQTGSELGRWPANVLHDGSAEVVELFPETAPATAGKPRAGKNGDGWGMTATGAEYDDNGGSAARFFYTAKADADDRLGSKHPTVKPLDLMQWLVRLVTPPGGTVLDCFAGTGTTGEAAFREGFNAILIEREAEYQEDIRRRMSLVLGGQDERRNASIKASGKIQDAGPLFAGLL